MNRKYVTISTCQYFIQLHKGVFDHLIVAMFGGKNLSELSREDRKQMIANQQSELKAKIVRNLIPRNPCMRV